METITLYPVKAPRTEPLIRSIAQQTARCQVMCDLIDNITMTAEEAHNYAVIEFGLFSNRQEVYNLTDDTDALQAMYVDAYTEMYHARYTEVIDNLAEIAKQRELDCAD